MTRLTPEQLAAIAQNFPREDTRALLAHAEAMEAENARLCAALARVLLYIECGHDPAGDADVYAARDEARAALEAEGARLRAALEEIRDLAGWHADDTANPDDESPEDMTAHVNGLIRVCASRALEATDGRS